MPEPTIVLVHGAFADASSWKLLYKELAAKGQTVIAPPNPLRGITGGDAEYLKSVIGQIEGPVVLVGHSYGGAVITAAGNADNVVGLVYVAAFAPDEGEALGGIQGNYPPPVAGPYITPLPLPSGGVEVSIAPSHFHEAFCADIPADEAAFMAIAQRPLFAGAFEEPAGTPAWRSRPSWAVFPTADGAIHPDAQRFMYERIGAPVTTVEGASHSVMLSHAPLVAEVVLEAARSSAPQAA